MQKGQTTRLAQQIPCIIMPELHKLF